MRTKEETERIEKLRLEASKSKDELQAHKAKCDIQKARKLAENKEKMLADGPIPEEGTALLHDSEGKFLERVAEGHPKTHTPSPIIHTPSPQGLPLDNYTGPEGWKAGYSPKDTKPTDMHNYEGGSSNDSQWTTESSEDQSGAAATEGISADKVPPINVPGSGSRRPDAAAGAPPPAKTSRHVNLDVSMRVLNAIRTDDPNRATLANRPAVDANSDGGLAVTRSGPQIDPAFQADAEPGALFHMEPHVELPAMNQPVTDQPAVFQPATDQPALNQPATDQPAMDDTSSSQAADVSNSEDVNRDDNRPLQPAERPSRAVVTPELDTISEHSQESDGLGGTARLVGNANAGEGTPARSQRRWKGKGREKEVPRDYWGNGLS